MKKINLAGRRLPVPGNRLLRIGLGLLFVIGGLIGFLPVVGFWMIPLGLAILAIDFPPVRRWQRRLTVALGNWLHRHYPRHARRFGYGAQRDDKR